MNRFGRNLSTLSLVMVAAAPIMAQETTGQIRGVVRDKAGRPLAGVTLEFTGPVLMMKRTVQTNERGEYRAPLLPPGEGYRIVASKSGYVTVPNTNIRLGLGQVVSLDFSMPEAKSAEAVVEVIATSAVQDKSEVSTQTVFNAEKLETLPGNNRGLETAALLAPGVSPNAGGRISIRGGTALDTKYLLNGTDISDNIYGQYDSRKFFVDDAIAETQVVSSPVNARFGGTSSGFINAVTKTGGNTFEGVVRVNLSSSSWAARRPMGPWRPNEGDSTGNRQSPGSDVMNRAWSIFVSGPVVKDRLWFAVSTKLDPPSAGANSLNSVPTGRYDFYYGKRLRDFYGTIVPVANNAYLGSDRALYAGPSAGAPYINMRNNQFYEFKLTGAITENHSVTVSGSKNDQLDSARLYGTAATFEALGPQWQNDKYASAKYTGILSSFASLEVQIAKKFTEYGGGGDPARGHRVRAYDNNGTTWQFNNATFDRSSPDQRNIRTINANLQLIGLDAGVLGQHTIDIGGEFITRHRRAANYQSPTHTTIYSLGSWMNGSTQNFIMRRHEPLIDNSPDPAVWYPLLLADRDPNWDTMYVKEVGQDSPTQTNIYSMYVNDVVTINQHLQVLLGLRYDRTDVADTFGKPTIKNTALSPRFQVTYDPFGNQKYVVRASWARYTGTLAEGFTNRFSLAGNPVSEYYTWKKNADSDFYTLADIQNDANWDLTQDGLLFVSNNAASIKADPNLKTPSNDEISLGLRYNGNDGSYAGLTFAKRTIKNPLDVTITHYAADQVDSFAPSFPAYSVPLPLNYWANSDIVQRDYQSMEFEFQGVVNPHFTISGNYTWSRLRGNGELDGAGSTSASAASSTANGTYIAVHEAMGHTRDIYAPYGHLAADSRHKARIWATYSVGSKRGASLDATLFFNYDGGTPWGLTRANTFNARTMAQADGAGNTGNYPTSYTRFYGSSRDLGRNNDTYSVDFKANLHIPLVKKVVFFAEFSVFNLFNHFMLTGLDFSTQSTAAVADNSLLNGWHGRGFNTVTASNGGINTYGFGTYGYGNFIAGRSVQVSTGIKW